MTKYRNIKIDESIGEFNKKVVMELVGLDGNAFSLMGEFSKRARRQGWTNDEINYVLEKCMSSDYDNLLRTLMQYTTEDEENPEFVYHNGKAYRRVGE